MGNCFTQTMKTVTKAAGAGYDEDRLVVSTIFGHSNKWEITGKKYSNFFPATLT